MKQAKIAIRIYVISRCFVNKINAYSKHVVSPVSKYRQKNDHIFELTWSPYFVEKVHLDWKLPISVGSNLRARQDWHHGKFTFSKEITDSSNYIHRVHTIKFRDGKYKLTYAL